MRIHIDTVGKDPIYKQIITQVERAIREGRIAAGEQIESMNEMAARLQISKETVKKSYGILVERGIIVPRQGKGFYAADLQSDARLHVLVIFDKLSDYKQTLFNAFADRLDRQAEITILTHNQSLDLLEYYLDLNLDLSDYYVITPHFPQDPKSQSRAVKLLHRIPQRKFIMLDRLLPAFQGKIGAVYQDFENDIYDGLKEWLDQRRRLSRLRVITLPTSLYGQQIQKGVERFADDYQVPLEFLTSAPERIQENDTFLVLNSQLDAGLVDLVRKIQAAGLEIGSQVRIISYNELDLNELILGGLTTVSTDFRKMGTLAADMILNRQLSLVHCPFQMIRRHTF